MLSNTSIFEIEKDSSQESEFNSDSYNKSKNMPLKAYLKILSSKRIYFEEIYRLPVASTSFTVSPEEELTEKDYELSCILIEKTLNKQALFPPAYLEQDIDKISLILKQYKLDEYIRDYKEGLLISIPKLIDELIGEEEVFKIIDKNELFKSLSHIVSNIPLEQISIPEKEFLKRLRKIMVLELISQIMYELTPEQLVEFGNSVKRRDLFK